jgi:signal transduction histidine kinase
MSEPGGCDAAQVISDLLLEGEALDTQGRAAVAASSDVLRALLAPLLENARFHQTTRAWVTTAETQGGLALHVHDDGPGFTPGNTKMAFTPGWSMTGGHGLGLAVVQRLAASHAILVSAHPGPGGHVELRLPRS